MLVGQAPQQPTFRVQVEAIEIDASVTDARGNVVTDLTRDDFEILENGKPQTITSFGLVNIPRVRAERPLFAANAIEPDVQSNNQAEGRLYVIALDQVKGQQILRTRRFVRRFLEQYFAPNDLGAVVFLGRADHSKAQGLTNNPRLLLQAVDSFTRRIECRSSSHWEHSRRHRAAAGRHQSRSATRRLTLSCARR